MTANTPGERLRAARDAAHISPTEFAQRAFIDIDKLSKIEHNKRSISGGELVRFAALVGVKPTDLLYGSSEPMLRRGPSREGGEEAIATFDHFIENWRSLRDLAVVFCDVAPNKYAAAAGGDEE